MEHFKIPWALIACILFSVMCWHNCKTRSELAEVSREVIHTRFQLYDRLEEVEASCSPASSPQLKVQPPSAAPLDPAHGSWQSAPIFHLPGEPVPPKHFP